MLSIGTGCSDDLVSYANLIANNSSYDNGSEENPIEMNYNFYSASMSYAIIDNHFENLFTGDRNYDIKSFDKVSNTWTSEKINLLYLIV